MRKRSISLCREIIRHRKEGNRSSAWNLGAKLDREEEGISPPARP